MKWFYIGILLLCGSPLWAQQAAPDSTTETEEIPWPQFYYQIFMEDSMQKIENVIYEDDSTEIEFKLSPDQMAIYLLDYDGQRRVKATYIDMQGNQQSISKPHCHIHGLEHL